MGESTLRPGSGDRPEGVATQRAWRPGARQRPCGASTRSPRAAVKWLVEGGSSNDPEVRKKAYSAAIQRITERAYWEPLHTYVTTYGYSKQLDFTPYADELPRFYLAKWK